MLYALNLSKRSFGAPQQARVLQVPSSEDMLGGVYCHSDGGESARSQVQQSRKNDEEEERILTRTEALRASESATDCGTRTSRLAASYWIVSFEHENGSEQPRAGLLCRPHRPLPRRY